MFKFFYLFLFLFSLNFLAEAEQEFYQLEIIEHKFNPEIIHVPSGKKLKLFIKNLDEEAEEFESFDLKREKMIPPKGEIIVNINPLEPGEYNFFGEFHIKTAQGKIIAEEKK